MNTHIQEEAIEGREPNGYERGLIAWADEAAGKGIALATDGLRLVATLATSLLAGSAFFMAHMPAAESVKRLSALLLLVALSASLIGLFPLGSVLNLSDVEAMERARRHGVRYKTWLLRIACVGLLAGLFVLVGGALASK